ncbi:MAG: UDP-N-acetylglucosamine--N-acetylmuramyl-(pentapeptide) pyrophosphoryl-undecaprenol N-acetylglucosamine transferase [Patescibacteria group bacterium]
MKKKKIILTGGGTGGHITPLLVIAENVKNEADIIFVGTGGMESRMVPSDIKFKKILAGKIRRYLTLGSCVLNIIDILKTIIGMVQSFFFVLFYNPDIVFAKGGYVSIPVVLTAAILRKKIYIHESDIIAGVSNKICGRFARKIFVGFPEKFYFFPKNKMIYSGVPVRAEFQMKKTDEDYNFFNFSSKEKVLLVTGGSQGSRLFNQFIEKNIEIILEKTQLIVLSGNEFYEKFVSIKERLGDKKDKFQVYNFLNEMDKAIRISDLIISRASATTMFEIAAALKPSILIPLSTSASGHQEVNANYGEEMGFAKKVSEKQFSNDDYIKFILDLLDNESELKKMSEACREFSKIDSIEIIKKEIFA